MASQLPADIIPLRPLFHQLISWTENAPSGVCHIVTDRHISLSETIHKPPHYNLRTVAHHFPHFGSYTEINYNDYSVGLLTLAVMAYHHGFANNSAKAILLSGLFVGTAFFFRIVNITFIGIPFLAWLVSYKYKSRLKTSHQFAAFFAGTAIACAVVTTILYATGMLEVFTMNLQDIFTRGHDPQDPHGVKTIIICLYDLYKGQI